MATKTSRIPRNLNFLGETAFLGGIFCLEYPSRCSEKVNCHFVNYRLSFCKLQFVISQTADFHFVLFHFVSQTTVSQKWRHPSDPFYTDSSLIRTLSSVPLVSVLRSLTVVTCIHAWETNPCKNEFVSMKCPHTSHVSRWSVSQFSKCMSLFRHGCSLPAMQLTWLPVSHSFWNSQTLVKYPDQMNWQFVLIMASKPPSQPSSPPIYYMNLSLA